MIYLSYFRQKLCWSNNTLYTSMKMKSFIDIILSKVRLKKPFIFPKVEFARFLNKAVIWNLIYKYSIAHKTKTNCKTKSTKEIAYLPYYKISCWPIPLNYYLLIQIDSLNQLHYSIYNSCVYIILWTVNDNLIIFCIHRNLITINEIIQ